MTNNTKNIQYILSNEACCICGRLSDIVCNECLALSMPACFCEKHQNSHRTERMHVAYWGNLAK